MAASSSRFCYTRLLGLTPHTHTLEDTANAGQHFRFLFVVQDVQYVDLIISSGAVVTVATKRQPSFPPQWDAISISHPKYSAFTCCRLTNHDTTTDCSSLQVVRRRSALPLSAAEAAASGGGGDSGLSDQDPGRRMSIQDFQVRRKREALWCTAASCGCLLLLFRVYSFILPPAPPPIDDWLEFLTHPLLLFALLPETLARYTSLEGDLVSGAGQVRERLQG